MPILSNIIKSISSKTIRSAPFSGYIGDAAPSLVLDSLSPAAAYSPARQILTAYSGPLIRVRRASDNVEQDFGFDVDGNLDVAAIVTFCGAAVGFITTMYDQANGHHVSNAEAAKQWRIYTGAAIYTKNSKPAAFSSTGSAYMKVTNGFTYTALSSCNVVQLSLANTAVYQFGAVNGGGSMVFNTSMKLLANSGQAQASTAFATGTWRQLAGTITPAQRRIWGDGVEGTPGVQASTLSGTNVGLHVGALAVGVYGAAGYFGDQVFFTREISDAERIAISNDQKAFYGTP